MARPKSRILLEFTDPNTQKTDQILEADAIWAVYYKDEPFNLKTTTSYAEHKYRQTSFSNPGPAHNLAKRLNDSFNCYEFQVIKLTKGVIVR